jgi:hypothetical protein
MLTRPIVLLLNLDLTEPVDIYSAWVDAADDAEKEIAPVRPRPAAGGRRQVQYASDDE